jgi:hypothetical protein
LITKNEKCVGSHFHYGNVQGAAAANELKDLNSFAAVYPSADELSLTAAERGL